MPQNPPHKAQQSAMHLEDFAIEPLKQWLETTLEPICEADPTVLGKYVIALLKNDLPDAELKELCREQLNDFLNDGENS